MVVNGEDGEPGKFRLKAGRRVKHRDFLLALEVEFLKKSRHGFSWYALPE